MLDLEPVGFSLTSLTSLIKGTKGGGMPRVCRSVVARGSLTVTDRSAIQTQSWELNKNERSKPTLFATKRPGSKKLRMRLLFNYWADLANPDYKGAPRLSRWGVFRIALEAEHCAAGTSTRERFPRLSKVVQPCLIMTPPIIGTTDCE